MARSRKKGRPDLPLLSVNLPNGVVLGREEDGRPATAEDLSAYQVVRRGDLVMNQLGKPHGALGVSEHDGIISPAYFVARIGKAADPRFIHHMLRTRLYISEYERRGKYMPPSQFDISWDQFRTIPVALPPLSEQRAIADFLDTETARIDALITKKRRMTALLGEWHQASIDRATGSIEDLVSVRYLVSRLTSGPRGWSQRAGDVGSPFIRITNIQRESIALDRRELLRVEDPGTAEAARTRVGSGDVLVSITADIGSVALAGDEDAGGFVSQHVALMTPIEPAGEWIAYAVRSTRARQELDAGQYGGTKTQLSLGDIAALKIPYPKSAVRDQRLTQLRASLTSVERAQRALRRQIALLQEHRQALITAAVTGELDVPGVAA